MTPPAPLQLPTADEALDWVRDRTTNGLASARELVAGLREDPPAEPEGVLRRWDEVTLALSNVGALAGLLSNVHPELEVRTACEEAEVEVDKLVTELRQDRALYDVFAGARPGAGSTRPRPGCWRRPSRSSGARVSTRTTRPGGGWPRSASGSPRSTRSSAATSATTSAP